MHTPTTASRMKRDVLMIFIASIICEGVKKCREIFIGCLMSFHGERKKRKRCSKTEEIVQDGIRKKQLSTERRGNVSLPSFEWCLFLLKAPMGFPYRALNERTEGKPSCGSLYSAVFLFNLKMSHLAVSPLSDVSFCLCLMHCGVWVDSDGE